MNSIIISILIKMELYGMRFHIKIKILIKIKIISNFQASI